MPLLTLLATGYRPAILRAEEAKDELRREATDLVNHALRYEAQGRIADRNNERLGRSDAAIILWRRLLARELAAIAAGRPLRVSAPAVRNDRRCRSHRRRSVRGEQTRPLSALLDRSDLS